MSVTATVAPKFSIVETLEGGTTSSSAPAGSRKVTHSEFDDQFVLNATSNPAISKVACFVQALTAGAATVNLAALTGTNGATVDGTGLKVQALKVKNLGANDLTISTGASNGYNFGGSAVIKPGAVFMIYSPEGLPDVAAGARNIDLAGTTTQTSEWSVLLG